MALTAAQVLEEVVAIIVQDPLTPPSAPPRGSGTAFWCDVGGTTKLVTAAHIPWHRPRPAPVQERLYVSWATRAERGCGMATLFSHTPNTPMDYCWIVCDASVQAPPCRHTFPLGPMPQVGEDIACIGYPVVPPSPSRADGKVIDVRSAMSSEAMVCGMASGGYSGGPVFRALPGGDLGDEVVGLMRGAPPLSGAKPDVFGNIPPDTSKWVLFGAVSFR